MVFIFYGKCTKGLLDIEDLLYENIMLFNSQFFLNIFGERIFMD